MKIKNLIVGGLLISVVCSLTGGLIHAVMNNKTVRERAEGICVVVGSKADEECKEIVDSAMNMTAQDFENYVSNAKKSL